MILYTISKNKQGFWETEILAEGNILPPTEIVFFTKRFADIEAMQRNNEYATIRDAARNLLEWLEDSPVLADFNKEERSAFEALAELFRYDR